MGHSPQTALELFQLAALFRQSAKESKRPQDRDRILNVAAEIETRARALAGESRDALSGKSGSDLFSRIDLII